MKSILYIKFISFVLMFTSCSHMMSEPEHLQVSNNIENDYKNSENDQPKWILLKEQEKIYSLALNHYLNKNYSDSLQALMQIEMNSKLKSNSKTLKEVLESDFYYQVKFLELKNELNLGHFLSFEKKLNDLKDETSQNFVNSELKNKSQILRIKTELDLVEVLFYAQTQQYSKKNIILNRLIKSNPEIKNKILTYLFSESVHLNNDSEAFIYFSKINLPFDQLAEDLQVKYLKILLKQNDKFKVRVFSEKIFAINPSRFKESVINYYFDNMIALKEFKFIEDYLNLSLVYFPHSEVLNRAKILVDLNQEEYNEDETIHSLYKYFQKNFDFELFLNLVHLEVKTKKIHTAKENLNQFFSNKKNINQYIDVLFEGAVADLDHSEIQKITDQLSFFDTFYLVQKSLLKSEIQNSDMNKRVLFFNKYLNQAKTQNLVLNEFVSYRVYDRASHYIEELKKSNTISDEVAVEFFEFLISKNVGPKENLKDSFALWMNHFVPTDDQVNELVSFITDQQSSLVSLSDLKKLIVSLESQNIKNKNLLILQLNAYLAYQERDYGRALVAFEQVFEKKLLSETQLFFLADSYLQMNRVREFRFLSSRFQIDINKVILFGQNARNTLPLQESSLRLPASVVE